MAINPRAISGPDPGAVPGGSTRFLPGIVARTVWGRHRIDGRVKVKTLPALAPLEAFYAIVANDNFAQDQALAA